MENRRFSFLIPYSWAALAYAAAIVLFFAPFFFAGKTFLPVDLYLMLYRPFSAGYPDFQPFNHFDVDILKFCYLYQWGAREYLYRPFWLPEIFGGIPAYANTYASHFSTLNWLLGLGPLAVTYPLKLLVSLWIAGISMFSFARHLRVSFWPGLLAGFCYMFSGLFITMLLRWWIPGAFAWVPFLLLGTGGLLRRGGAGDYFFCAAMLAFAFLDGFFQSSASILLAWGTYLLVFGWQEERWPGVARAIARGAAVVGFAFALSAIMWLPQLEYFYLDTEKGSTRTAGLYFQKNLQERLLSLPALLAAFFPQLLGSPQTLDLGKFIRSHLQDFAPFVGTLPLLLALAAWGRRRERVEWTALWALVLLGLLVPIATPLDRYFYFRFLAVYIVGICALAACGLEAALREPSAPALRRLEKIALAIWAVIAAGALALRVFITLKPGWLEEKAAGFVAARLDQVVIGAGNPEWMLERARAFVRFYAFGFPQFGVPLLLVLAAIALLGLWRRGRIGRPAFLGGVFLVTGMQLAIGVHSWLGFHSPARYPLFPDNDTARFLRALDPRHEYRVNVNDFHRPSPKTREIFPRNTSFFFGYYALEGFDGVRPGTLLDITMFENYRSLGLMNVKYVLTQPGDTITDPALRLLRRGDVDVYENRFAQPRGRVYRSFRVLGREEIRERMTKSGMDGRTVLIEEEPDGLVSVERDPESSARIEEDTRTRIVYRIDGSGPGLFLATETFYPGWKAFWNGAPVKILAANAYMRAVALPSGKGTLEFRFEPESYALGRRISVIAWLAGLAILARSSLRSRQRRKA